MQPHLPVLFMIKKSELKIHGMLATVVVAEWLRRLTRNQMGYTRTGSNPVHDGEILTFCLSKSYLFPVSLIIQLPPKLGTNLTIHYKSEV